MPEPIPGTVNSVPLNNFSAICSLNCSSSILAKASIITSFISSLLVRPAAAVTPLLICNALPFVNPSWILASIRPNCASSDPSKLVIEL